jgi:DNA gyrase/topoisomerase IV subunit B
MPPKKTPTTKQTYAKKDPIDHILTRSDMYVGSKRLKSVEEYIASLDKKNGSYRIYKKYITSSAAILRIFVEVLSNSLDNVERSKKTKTPCTTIKVFIDKDTGETSVWNDGLIIPVEIQNEENIYNHTLIFGHLMSGSNYNDEEERLVSGRNGLGSKLTSVFSKKFTVKGLDPNNKKVLEQTWTNNMRDTKGPIVTDTKLTNGFTKVTYFPDFKQFDIEEYSDDIINLYIKYIIDAAMLARGVNVYFNDELISIDNLHSYSQLYDTVTDESLLIKYKNSEVLITPCNVNEFQAISFVNGVYTRLGGQHVDAWSEVLFRPLVEKFNKKDKPSINIKDIKQFFRIFVVSTVANPEFDSQEKNKLETPKIVAEVKQSDINKILKWSVIEEINDIIRMKEMVVLKKSEKKKKGYTKVDGLDPANNAGGKLGHECSLILCEGDSAKTYAVAGIQKGIYGKSTQDWYGILTLRGKCLNVRNSLPATIAKNKVITNLIQSLGVRHDLDYTDDKNYKTLSYGKVILLTDADCFTDDTALLVKKNDNVSIIDIDSLYNENMLNTQLVKDTQVWSDKGWVNIMAIRRKTTTKNILTINTHCGIVRCTEDHKLLLENGDEIRAIDIKIGDKLLRNRRIDKIPIVDDTMTHPEIHDIMKNLQCYNTSRYTSKKTMINGINEELKYCTEYNIDKKDYFNISVEESWVWGFFFADGTCGIYTFEKDRKKYTDKSRKRWKKWVEYYTKKINDLTIQLNEAQSNNEKYGRINSKLKESKIRLQNALKNTSRESKEYKNILERTNYCFNITNCNYEKLIKAYNIVKKYYPEYNWTIVETTVLDDNHQRTFRLILNGGKKVKDFIECMRSRFYTDKKLKKVPDEILNNSLEIQQSFYEGYYDGDEFRSLKENKNSEGFDILGQVGAQGLCYIVNQLGYCFNIKEKIENSNIFTIHVSKRYKRFYPGTVRQIYNTEYTDRFVFDIETETGKINAGVGEMVQRQCDGLHISGLIMNFFHSLFPSLLERKDPFIISLCTPIVKVFNKGEDILFYDENRFKKFAKEQLEKNKPFKCKYYKGLGSTAPKDVPKTFGMKLIEFVNDDDSTTNMNKIFHKKHADTRKNWLENYDDNPEYSIDDDGEIVDMDISSFLNNEVIKFSHDDCKRSIPNLFDGLKESQRKVLYTAKKINLTYNKKDLKVAQFGAEVAKRTNYHHGENNLFDTIVKMAQDFVGSNNIPLFYRDGAFGSRISGGKDAASPRYIFTKMEILTPLIFREEDDVLLEYLIDDGDLVEPKFYIPILPMILVNGALGIGTGWSCLASQTPVLLWNGNVKTANNIKIGDILIGDNGTPRNVLNTCSGEDDLYEIKQSKGDSYIVNSNHILSFVVTGHKSIYPYFSRKCWAVNWWDNDLLKIRTKTIAFSDEIIENDKSYICEECNKKLSHRSSLYHHIKKFHPLLSMPPPRIPNHYSKLTCEEAKNKLVEFLKIIPDNNKIDIKISDYMKLSKSTKKYLLGFTGDCVQWEKKEVPIDPYILGMWLGDGSKDGYGFSADPEKDKELITYWEEWSKDKKIIIKNRRKFDYGIIRNNVYNEIKNPFTQSLRDLNLINNKHIPKEYLINNKQTRMSLLAGLIDTDGSGGTDNELIFTQSLKEHTNLINDTIYLAKSLGFSTTSYDYDSKYILKSGEIRTTRMRRLRINGDFSELPMLISRKFRNRPTRNTTYSNIKSVIHIGKGSYNGFSVDENRRFLLGDFTVTHNCSIPCYNPLDIIECIKTWLDNDGEVLIKDPDDGSIVSMLPEIKPFYRNFKGKIEEYDNKYITYGIINKDKDKVTVSELPINMWTDKFKETCEDWLVDKKIKSCKFYSTPEKINFIITESDDGLNCNINNMGLYSYLHTTNMVLFNEKEQIKKYTVDQIINDFCIVRYKFYTKRKNHIINTLEKDLKYLGNKERFIQEIIDKKLNIMNIDEEIIIKELETRKYDKINKMDENEEDKTENKNGYNYLLNLPVKTLTSNNIKKIKNDILSLKNKLENINKISESKMWLNDLKEFEDAYKIWYKNMEKIFEQDFKIKKTKK